MPEQQILMKVRTCNMCHLQGEHRPGHQYDVTITKSGPFTQHDEVVGDDLIILCEDHAGPVVQVLNLLTEHANPGGPPEVVEIESLEVLERFQSQRELEPPADAAPAEDPSPPPPASVRVKDLEVPTQQAHVVCLECSDHPELQYSGIGPHLRSQHKGMTYKDVKWEFIKLPEGAPVYECDQPRETGGRCQAKYTHLPEIVAHQKREKHVDPKWTIRLRNREAGENV